MSERAVIEDRLRKKEAEVAALEDKLRVARIYMQALNDIMRAVGGGDAADDLKPGTMIAQARDAIMAAGKPLHVDALLKAIGRPADSKSSLTGSLAAYVRRKEIFTRPGPNVYGLVDAPAAEFDDDEAPPPTFGGSRRPIVVEENLDDDVPF
jgi:hypothetical protein